MMEDTHVWILQWLLPSFLYDSLFIFGFAKFKYDMSNYEFKCRIFCCLFTIFSAWLQSIFKWYFHHHIRKILESFYFAYLSSSTPSFIPGTTIMCLLHLLRNLTVLDCPASLLFPISFSVHISIWQILLIYFQTPLFPKLSVFSLPVGLSKVCIFC